MTRLRIYTAYHELPRKPISNALFHPFLSRKGGPADVLGPHPDLPSDSYADTHMHYAVWKELPNLALDYIGFQQYRRLWGFFIDQPPSAHTYLEAQPQDFTGYSLRMQFMSPEQMQATAKAVSQHDIVVPRPMSLDVEAQYRSVHISEHWDILVEEWDKICLVHDLAPYADIKPKMAGLFPGNMFIARVDIVDAYVHFWSDLMQALSARIAVPDDPYQRRVYAFLGERIFTMWIVARHLKGVAWRMAALPIVYAPMLQMAA